MSEKDSNSSLKHKEWHATNIFFKNANRYIQVDYDQKGLVLLLVYELIGVLSPPPTLQGRFLQIYLIWKSII